MCGIAGIITGKGFQPDPGKLTHRIRRMMDMMSHRGPDDWGMHRFLPGIEPNGFPVRDRSTPVDEGFCVFGHRRLSIIDLTEAGRQPFTLEDAGLTITYNGEIYNYLELREGLEDTCQFTTQTDTEVLLRAYEKWGLGVVDHLDGMFAFVIRDAVNRRFVCVRDHLGIKPFYYCNAGEMLLFGSEPAVVLTGLGSFGHIDPVHAAEFLYLGLTDHDDGTFYREVSQLSPGSLLVLPFGDGTAVRKRYWTPAFSTDVSMHDAPEVFTAAYRDHLRASVNRQLRADVATGSCLSGGLDSGSIVSAVSDCLGRSASDYACLTVVSPGTPWDESRLAERTVRKCGCHWIRVEPSQGDMAREIETMAYHMGEPFNGLSVFAQYKVMEQAHRHNLKVMLDGQGGDELFMGYPRMAQAMIFDRIRSGKWATARRDLWALRNHGRQPVIHSLMSMLYFHSPGIAWRRNRRRMASFIDPGLEEHVRPETLSMLYDYGSVAERQRAEFSISCLPRLLRYEDRNSMAFSVEARVPILGRDVVRFALKLPEEWKVSNGWTKYIVRKSMDGILPDEVVWNNRKKGFDVPEGLWMSLLSASIGHWLRDSGVLPVRCESIQKALCTDCAMTQWFWRLVSFVLWARVRQVGI